MAKNIEVELDFGNETEWNKEKLKEFILENKIVFQETPKFHKHMKADIKIKGIQDLFKSSNQTFFYPINSVEEEKIYQLLLKLSTNPESISNSQTEDLLKFFSKDIGPIMRQSKTKELVTEESLNPKDSFETKKSLKRSSVFNVGNEYVKEKCNSLKTSKTSNAQRLRNSMIDFPTTPPINKENLTKRNTFDPKLNTDSKVRISNLKESLVSSLQTDAFGHKKSEPKAERNNFHSKSPKQPRSSMAVGSSIKKTSFFETPLTTNQKKARHTVSLEGNELSIFRIEDAKRKEKKDANNEDENIIRKIEKILEDNGFEEGDEDDFYDEFSLKRRANSAEKQGNPAPRTSQRGSMIEKTLNLSNLAPRSSRFSINDFISMSPPPNFSKKIEINKKAKFLIDELKNMSYDNDLKDIAKTLKDRKFDNTELSNLDTKLNRKKKAALDPKLFLSQNMENRCLKESKERAKLINILQRHLLKLFIRIQNPQSCTREKNVMPNFSDIKERIEMLSSSELISYYDLINKKAAKPFFKFSKEINSKHKVKT